MPRGINRSIDVQGCTGFETTNGAFFFLFMLAGPCPCSGPVAAVVGDLHGPKGGKEGWKDGVCPFFFFA